MTKLDRAIKMTVTDYNHMLESLNEVKADLNKEVTETDVRLCIDFDGYMNSPTWIIRSGDASYDQKHSFACGASGIDSDTKCEHVLEDLINQCLDQIADTEGNS